MFYTNYKNYFDALNQSNIPMVHSLEIKEKQWKKTVDVIGDTVVSIKRNKIKIKCYHKDENKTQVRHFNVVIPDLINRNSLKASIKGNTLSIYGIWLQDNP